MPHGRREVTSSSKTTQSRLHTALPTIPRFREGSGQQYNQVTVPRYSRIWNCSSRQERLTSGASSPSRPLLSAQLTKKQNCSMNNEVADFQQFGVGINSIYSWCTLLLGECSCRHHPGYWILSKGNCLFPGSYVQVVYVVCYRVFVGIQVIWK